MGAPGDHPSTVVAGRASHTADAGPPWWTGAVGYQIYIQSFKDASGDGVGDLEGLRGGLPHIADLGVDYVWITPFYSSPQADHGYDVADHCAVDPNYGSLDDFDRVVEEAHGHGLRVVVDIVPNHTSDHHPWFRDATRSRDAAHRDYYVWRDPGPGGGPPNNWVSKFGGPAWTWHEATGQYYLHTFLPEQPDLNWANAKVADEFDRILRFWLDRGVDGFRIDTAHLLVKDPGLRDNPQPSTPPAGVDPQVVYESFDHRYDLDQRGVTDVYRRWHRVVRAFGAMLLGEVALDEPDRVRRYVTDGVLDLAFYFPALKATWDAGSIRAALQRATAISNGRFVWPLSSHDDPRATDRFGGGERGRRRSLAYLTLLMGLPGGVCLLQGDELGLAAGKLPTAHRRDPVATRNPGAMGRDGSRTPVPWDTGPGFGFTTGQPWMPFPAGVGLADTVAGQRLRADSPLHRTRALIAARRQLTALQGAAPVVWTSGEGPLVSYRSNEVVVALNTADTTWQLRLPAGHELIFASSEGTRNTHEGLGVPPDTAVLCRVPAEREPTAPAG